MATDQRFGEEFIDGPEAATESALAASSLGPLTDRIESVAGEFVTDQNLEKKTHFKSWAEPNLYARMSFLLSLMRNVGDMDKPLVDDEGHPLFTHVEVRADGEHIVAEPRGFRFPEFTLDLVRQDLRYRDSFREGTRKHLRDITKIFERGEGGKRGGLFRR